MADSPGLKARCMMFAKLSAEFIGTFWLVLGGCGSAVLAAAFPQLGIGLRMLRFRRDRCRGDYAQRFFPSYRLSAASYNYALIGERCNASATPPRE
jgi:hypothetical protein